MSKKADRYERNYPNTGISEAQKEARQDRIEYNERKRGDGRTSGSRFVSVPDLPWLRKENEDDETKTDALD